MIVNMIINIVISMVVNIVNMTLLLLLWCRWGKMCRRTAIQ